MAFLTILEPRREARARPGRRGHESPASRRDLKRRLDPRVPVRDRVGVRISFSRDVVSGGNASDSCAAAGASTTICPRSASRAG
jgi:hypothetical protein